MANYSQMSFDYSPSPSSPSLSQPIPTVDELAVTARRVKNLTQAISDAKDGWKGAEEALGICSTVRARESGGRA